MSYLAMIRRQREEQSAYEKNEINGIDLPSETKVERAAALLNHAGCRYIVDLETRSERIGIWSDLDSSELRQALSTLCIDLPVVYLDSDKCPDHYKVRRVPGEPVPLSVLVAMERASEPWKVRDQLLRRKA